MSTLFSTGDEEKKKDPEVISVERNEVGDPKARRGEEGRETRGRTYDVRDDLVRDELAVLYNEERQRALISFYAR